MGNAPTPENEVPPNLPPTSASSVPVRFKKGLLDLGYNLQLNYTGEVLGNPTGGVKQGAINEGLFEMSIYGDLDKNRRLERSNIPHQPYVIHGRGLSTFNLFDISPFSGIEARPTTQLFEAWSSSSFSKGSRRFGSDNCRPIPNSSSAICGACPETTRKRAWRFRANLRDSIRSQSDRLLCRVNSLGYAAKRFIWHGGFLFTYLAKSKR
jgi:hypothetical protein